MLRCMEDAAYRRTWATGLYRLQDQLLPVLAFVPAGRGLGPGKGSTSRRQS